MWDHVGLLRSEEGLRHALDTVRTWRARAAAPATLAEHEDANLLLLAEATASAALARRDSVGAHYRLSDAETRTAIPILETV